MFKGITVIAVALAWSVPAFAAHPLITDDTGTQGKGKLQFEFIGEFRRDKEDGITTKSLTFPTIPFLSFGIADTIDVMFGVPYMTVMTEEAGQETRQSGFSDESIEMKARFYEKNGLSLAVKPGISLPTGDENKGLGAGKTGYHVFLIGTKEAAPWAFHANLGYIRNGNRADEEKNLWHASLAATCEVVKDLKLVGNVGIERNTDKTADNDPAFLIAGAIYTLAENVDIDFGVKAGLTQSETDYSMLAGLTYRY